MLSILLVKGPAANLRGGPRSKLNRGQFVNLKGGGLAVANFK